MVNHPVDRGDTRRHFEAGADITIGLGDAQMKVTRKGTLELALVDLQKEGMDFVVVEGFKHSDLPKIALGDIEAPNVLRKLKISEVDESTVSELTKMVLQLKDCC
jgi:molybdopterin-guanine dinucleotide biosynthesis protein MobB